MKKMNISKTADRPWHQERGHPPRLTKAEHRLLIEKMGISLEQDEKWHREHEMPLPTKEQIKSEGQSINPFAIGGGFLTYCVKQGWLLQEGKGRAARYFVTAEGRERLKDFDIKIYLLHEPINSRR
jgi:hypothetical protein